MIIEALSDLAYRAGAERVSLEIHPTSEGTANVVVFHVLGQVAGAGDEKQAKLLAALAQPIALNGSIGDMDERLVSVLDSLESDVVEAANALPDTDVRKLRAQLKDAGKDAPKEEASDAATEKVGSPAKAKATSDDDAGEEPAAKASAEDEFATGEAESL